MPTLAFHLLNGAAMNKIDRPKSICRGLFSSASAFTTSTLTTLSRPGQRKQAGSVLAAAVTLAMSASLASAAPDAVITLNSGATNLNSPASYTPALPPSAGTDILFSAANAYTPILTANANLTTGSINNANGVALTITNNGVAASTLSISAAPGSNNTAVTGAGSVNDVIFVKAGSNLTIANGVNPLNVAFTTGGNVENAGRLTISSAVTVANGQTVTFTGGGTTTVSGPLAATTGAIAVNNAGGTLILSGTNLYTGGTTVNAGALAVGNPGALGAGSVTNNGTLETTATPIAGAPTTAPLAIVVANNYTQGAGGTLLLQVATSPAPTPSPNSGIAGINYDTLNVAGTATLAGVLDLNFAGATVPSQGQRYVAVTAGAPLTSEFVAPTTTNLAPPYLTVTTYNDTFNGTQPLNSVVVTILQPLGSFSGLTPNQLSVARNVDANLNNLNGSGALAMPSGAAADFFNNIVTGLNLSTYGPGGLGRSLDELSPQRYEILRNVAFDNYAFDVQSLDDELARERYTRGGIDTSGFAFTDSALGPQLSMIKSRLLAWSPAPETHGLLSDSSQAELGGIRMTDPKDMKQMTPTAQLNRWNGFIDGGVDLGDLDHNSDTSHSSYTTGRVRGGIDYLVCDDFRVGALFGYAHTSADLDEEGSNADVDSYTPGIYAAYADKQGFYANSLFTYTRNDYSTQRDIVIPGVNRAATASPSGNQFGGDLDGGYEFHRGSWTFGPSAGLSYVNLGIDSFNESGASSAGLSVNSQSAESLRSKLGGAVRYQAKLGSLVMTPHLSAYWQHEFLDGPDLITSQFEGLPASGFSVQTVRGDEDNALLDFGIDAEIADSVTVFVDYQTEAGGDNYFGQSASGGVKVGF